MGRRGAGVPARLAVCWLCQRDHGQVLRAVVDMRTRKRQLWQGAM